jgi:hypothetical protein
MRPPTRRSGRTWATRDAQVVRGVHLAWGDATWGARWRVTRGGGRWRSRGNQARVGRTGRREAGGRACLVRECQPVGDRGPGSPGGGRGGTSGASQRSVVVVGQAWGPTPLGPKGWRAPAGWFERSGA